MALLVEYLHIGVDTQAVHRSQDGAAEPGAVEGRGAQFGETVGLLAEIVVLLSVEEAVILVHFGEKGVLGLAGKAQLVGELF